MPYLPYIVIGVVVLVIIVILVRCIRVVQQAKAYVIERLGAYKTTWNVGLHFKLPFIERVAKVVSLKEQVADFPPQPVITEDNVTMQIDTVVYFQITDPKLYTYGIERPIVAIENLSATTLRNIIGDLELDQCLTSRDVINTKMRAILDEATDPWGIKVNRVELKNILPPREIQNAMEKQMKPSASAARPYSAPRARRNPPSSPPRAKRNPPYSAPTPRSRPRYLRPRRGRGHPHRSARHRRGHQAHQRGHADRPRHQAQGPGGLRRRSQRPRDEDHHPLRDPGPRRPGRGHSRGRQAA